MWRSWIEHPPQIPWAPVIITNRTHSKPIDEFPVIMCKNLIPPEFNIANLAWCPTGIYREEFYQVTGRWE